MPTFFATVLVLVAAMVWMGVQLLRQDRALAGQRLREQCDDAADLAVASLQQQLSRTEERLTALSAALNSDLTVAAGAFANRLTAGSVLLVLGASGMDVYPERRLLFVPDAARPPSAVLALFAEADALEFRRETLRDAIAVLRPLTRHADRAVRAEAQLRLARCLWKSGDPDTSLAAYRDLAQFRSLPVLGIPAEIAAGEGRILIFEARSDRDSLQREGAALCEGLRSGKWPLSRRAYAFYRNEACGRAGTATPPDPPETVALAVAAEEAWANRGAGGGGRRIVWHENTPILLVWRTGVERTAVAALGRRHIEANWLNARLGVRIALSDPEGRIVAGAAAQATVPQTVRLAAATHLPWTLHASVPVGSGALPARNRLMLTALLTLVLLVLAGVYFIGRAAARELEVGKLQSDFVASISHEFRTPITALRQLSEMLVSGRARDDQERGEFYRAMAAESERLHRLVEGLLSFGRMEAGAIEFRMETLDAAELLATVVAEFRKSADARQYQIELDNGDTQRPRVRCDRAALTCVLWNLLENAVKYSPECRHVWVGLAREGCRAVIRIRDSGIGIPPAEQKQIFEKFVRGAGAKSRSIRGAGIGLAIAEQIVAAHHGAIAVESVPGEGSVFSVLLPAVE
ncbi:MAG: HAMP domain-containing histidine kinase [Acidobacteria bacterium]|nr:HAMP domain-containing histidine kinase [Acidobacteriota bacterium]